MLKTGVLGKMSLNRMYSYKWSIQCSSWLKVIHQWATEKVFVLGLGGGVFLSALGS